jgi:hypothetical protein
MRYAKLMLRTCSRVIALTAMVAGLSMTAQAAEPATLTLACKGTVTDMTPNAKPEPLSMGLIVNLTARTILGSAGPGSGTPVDILFMDDVTVTFFGSYSDQYRRWRLSGTIDRVTGDLEATNINEMEKTSSESWTLKCKPAQRMF